LFSPTDLDIYAPGRWVDDALFRPEVRDAYRRLVEQDWTSASAGRILSTEPPLGSDIGREDGDTCVIGRHVGKKRRVLRTRPA
jgi:hypothetical protein